MIVDIRTDVYDIQGQEAIIEIPRIGDKFVYKERLFKVEDVIWNFDTKIPELYLAWIKRT